MSVHSDALSEAARLDINEKKVSMPSDAPSKTTKLDINEQEETVHTILRKIPDTKLTYSRGSSVLVRFADLKVTSSTMMLRVSHIDNLKYTEDVNYIYHCIIHSVSNNENIDKLKPRIAMQLRTKDFDELIISTVRIYAVAKDCYDGARIVHFHENCILFCVFLCIKYLDGQHINSSRTENSISLVNNELNEQFLWYYDFQAYQKEFDKRVSEIVNNSVWGGFDKDVLSIVAKLVLYVSVLYKED